MARHPCAGCVDWVPLGGIQTCDYIGHNNRARSPICPPGAGCTVKSTVPRTVVRQKKSGKKLTWDAEKARQMHSEGYNDAQIARAVGAKMPCYVQAWRKRNHLPANAKQGNFSPEVEL